MFTSDWIEVLQFTFQSLWVKVMSFLPEILLALLIVIVGWIVGGSLKHLIEKIFSKLKVNQLLNAAGASKLAERAGYELKAGVFIGALVKWFIIIVFIVAALDVLNLTQVTVFFRDDVLSYLPRVVVAVLILFGAIIISDVLHASVEAAARAAGFGSSELLGNVARYAVLLFAVLAALSQLQIAPDLVKILFAGFVFAASLALGLSFGLGGREAASRYIESASRKKDNSQNLS